MKETNQLVAIGGAVLNANLLWLAGGGKSISFLPPISKEYISIAGQNFPSSDSLDNIGTDLQKAYALYSLQY